MRWWSRGVVAVAIVSTIGGTGWYLSSAGELQVVEASDQGPSVPAPAEASTTTTTTTIGSGEQDTTTTTVEAPPCTVDDQPAEGDPVANWATIAIDATYALPADFVPPDLVDVAAAGFTTGDRIREVAVSDLDAIRRGAEAAGNPVTMVSAYRGYTYQDSLFDNEVEARGLEAAQLTTARPGHSEHQLGTAVDLSDADGAPLDAGFAATPTARWLSAHAHEFGFVVSFPDVAPARSCYQHEPWHLRYVGRDLARQVEASGLTLREWLLTR